MSGVYNQVGLTYMNDAFTREPRILKLGPLEAICASLKTRSDANHTVQPQKIDALNTCTGFRNSKIMLSRQPKNKGADQ